MHTAFWKRLTNAEGALALHIMCARMATHWRDKLKEPGGVIDRAFVVASIREFAADARQHWAEFLRLKEREAA